MLRGIDRKIRLSEGPDGSTNGKGCCSVKRHSIAPISKESSTGNLFDLLDKPFVCYQWQAIQKLQGTILSQVLGETSRRLSKLMSWWRIFALEIAFLCTTKIVS